MTNKDISRRKVLLGIGTGTTIALAGCSSPSSDGTPSKSSFNYPEGFSKEGIEDFKKAMGTESAHYKSESFSFESTYRFEKPNSDTDQVINAKSQISGVNKKQYYRTETSKIVQEQYNNGTTAYLRYYQKSDKTNAQYQIQDTKFNREKSYLLGLFRDQFQNVDFSVDKVLSKDEVRYIATKEDVPDDHAFMKKYNNISSLTLKFTINTEGYITKTDVSLTKKSSNGTKLDESYVFTFSKFNNTTVEKPNWISEAKQYVQQKQKNNNSTTSGSSTSDKTTTKDSSK